jgi:hypothetical protein
MAIWYILLLMEIFYGHLVYFAADGNILWSFGILCGHLVHFPSFGILCQNSGNPVAQSENIFKVGYLLKLAGRLEC